MSRFFPILRPVPNMILGAGLFSLLELAYENGGSANEALRIVLPISGALIGLLSYFSTRDGLANEEHNHSNNDIENHREIYQSIN